MTRTITLTAGEARAALEAISQMTSGNGYSYSEWRSQTHGTYGEWQALRRAEKKIIEAFREHAATLDHSEGAAQ
jgi:hypothetical protein